MFQLSRIDKKWENNYNITLKLLKEYLHNKNNQMIQMINLINLCK
jgi:hypothetical protein